LIIKEPPKIVKKLSVDYDMSAVLNFGEWFLIHEPPAIPARI